MTSRPTPDRPFEALGCTLYRLGGHVVAACATSADARQIEAALNFCHGWGPGELDEWQVLQEAIDQAFERGAEDCRALAATPVLGGQTSSNASFVAIDQGALEGD